MILFDTVKSHFTVMGVNSVQAKRKNPLNFKNVTVILMTSIEGTLSGIFVFCEANSFREYVESIFVFSTIFIVNIVFLHFIWNMSKVFELMNNIEKTVNKSKY